MARFTLTANGEAYTVDVLPDTPLLWVLRDTLGLTGTKYGCGIGLCRACVVHLEGQAVPACLVPMSTIDGQSVTTIEGLASGDTLHPVQQAWIEEDVPQCGYCQAGQIMSVVKLLEQHPNPTDENIDEVMSAHICRCGTYPRIRRAIHRAAELTR